MADENRPLTAGAVLANPPHVPVGTPEFVELATGAQVFAIHKDYRLAVEPDPDTPKRRHRFESVRDFCKFILRHASPSTSETFVEARQIVCDFCDEPNSHLIRCSLDLDPTYEAWRGALTESNYVSQHELLRLLRQSGEVVLADVRSHLLAQLGALKVSAGGSLEVQIDHLGTTRFAGSSKTAEVSGSLPASITIHGPVFQGIERNEPGMSPDQEQASGDPQPEPERWVPARYLLEVFIEVHVQDNAARFSLDAPGLFQIERRAREDVVEFVRHLLGTDPHLVSLGEHEIELIGTPSRIKLLP